MCHRHHSLTPQSRAHSAGGEVRAAERPPARDWSGRPGGMRRMTCQELRLFFEDPLAQDTEFRAESEHLATCRECARFVDTQRQLRSGLRRLRASVPQFPEKLDVAVLTNYRRDIVNRPSNVNAAAARRRTAIFCMSG